MLNRDLRVRLQQIRQMTLMPWGQVHDDDELMLITQQGKILRMASRDIRTIGRATQGVRLIDIKGDDRAVSVARLAEKDEDAANGTTAEPSDDNGGTAPPSDAPGE